MNEFTKVQNYKSENNFSYFNKICDVAKPSESSSIYFASEAKHIIKLKKVINKGKIESLISAFN